MMSIVTISLAACDQSGPPPAGTDAAPAPAAEAPAAPAQQAPAEPAHELAGTAWQLVEIASMDDSVITPDDPAKYTLSFGDDGRAAIVADCNRGSGSWEGGQGAQLTFGPIAATLAMCPPESVSEPYMKQFQWVRSYVLRDGHLFLATMADGAIIEFSPLP